MKDDKLFLVHMRECIERIETYTEEGREDFFKSSLKQDGVIRNFEIIGEAAKNVSEDLKRLYPEIAWRRVAGFRDVLIHNYFGVDLNEVWNIVQRDLPSLKSKIEKMLSGPDIRQT